MSKGTDREKRKRLCKAMVEQKNGGFRSTHLHLAINSVTLSAWSVVPPISSPLTIRTISRHVSCVTTDTTDDVGSEVALLGTLVPTMADLATVLTRLILVVTESTVQRGKFTQLVPLQFILSFGDRCSL